MLQLIDLVIKPTTQFHSSIGAVEQHEQTHLSTDTLNHLDHVNQPHCQQANIDSSFRCNSQESHMNEILDFNPRDVNFADIQNLWYRKDAVDIIFRVAFVAPIVLLGIVGNLTIIYSMCKFKPFRSKPTNIFILNMAIADLLTTMVCPIAALITDINQFYVLGSFICRFEGFIKITCLLVKSYSLIVLSCEWLLGVVKPFRKRISINQSWLTFVIIWITSIIMASPLFVWRQLRQRHWKDLVETWCCEFIQYTKYYWVVINFFLIYLPTFFMTIVLVVILVQMDKFEAKLRRSRADSNQSNSSLTINMKYRRRIVKILITYLFTSFICWTPLQFTIIYRHFRKEPVPAPWFFELTFFAQLCASLTAAMNPIIFGFHSQAFRRVLTKSMMFKFLDKIVGTNGRSSDNPNPDINIHAMNNRNNHNYDNKRQHQTNTHHHHHQSHNHHNHLVSAVNGSHQAKHFSETRSFGVKRSFNIHQGPSHSGSLRNHLNDGHKGRISHNTNTKTNVQRIQPIEHMPDMKRVSFNTTSHNQVPTTTNDANNCGLENSAFDSHEGLSSTSQRNNHQVGRLEINGHRQTSTTSFMNREIDLRPLSFVSMNSINIEENLGQSNGFKGDDTT